MRFSFLYPAILGLLALTPDLTIAAKAKTPKNAVLLSNVKSLTLRHGSKTSHRRVSAVPQLKCIGGNAKGLHNVDVMRCTNQGSDYDEENIQWSCTANLPEEFKLGSTDVICEGYDSSSDPYVLKGSCGVEYRLMLTDRGEEKFGKKNMGLGTPTSLATTLFWIVFALVAGWILYSIWLALGDAPVARAPRRGGGWGGGWGGGGGGPGGDPWDPPPPYPGKRHTKGAQQEGWTPGFWSGTAAGAAAGYMAGSRGARRDPPVRSSWLGGNGGNAFGGDPSPGPITRSSSGSSSRHESTGFGSTSRR